MRKLIKNLDKNLFNNNIKLLPIIFLVLFSRFIPHPPNFTPIIAVAILSPLFFNKNNVALTLVIVGMFISDFFIGFYQNMITTYLAIILVYYFSKFYFNEKTIGIKNIIFGSIFSALIFYVLTNFSVWVFGDLYPKNFEGLIMCYVMAIPFFTNTLISTFLFTSVAYTSSIYIIKKTA